MRQAVRDAFWSFTQPLEGYVRTMYCDVLGLVTTGVGNLIDPVGLALGLPWLRVSDNQPASAEEIAAEWAAVKTGRLANGHGQRALYLTSQSVGALVGQRLQQNEVYLARRWSNWNEWPADAQLGAHSCAWAAGSGWAAPKFDHAVATLDFMVCAGLEGDGTYYPFRGEAWLRDDGNPGLRPRNLANKLLFQNAARVVAQGLDRDTLHWPDTVPS